MNNLKQCNVDVTNKFTGLLFLLTLLIIVCRDALTKMKDVYIKNPHLGDPDSIDPRLEEITQSLEKLQLEAQKFEVSP